MQQKPISSHCPGIPQLLAESMDNEFSKIQEHFLLSEYDDLLVDSGRICEAVLRYLEWRTNEDFTPIDGRSKPNRSQVVNAARKDMTLEPSVRQQVINLVETVLDFRNNRNAAHLGSIDPNIIDATTAYQMISWVMAEVLRVEAKLNDKDIQELMNKFAERPIPVVYTVAGRPQVLDVNISHLNEVLVLLYDSNSPVDLTVLFKWTHHSNITRWKKNVIDVLVKERLIVLENKKVYILPGGSKRAEDIITAAAVVNS